MVSDKLDCDEMGLLAMVFFRECLEPVREFELGITSRGHNYHIILSELVKNGFLEKKEKKYFCTDRSKKILVLVFAKRASEIVKI